MCGILGLISKTGEQNDVVSFLRALKTIKHRGPDDEGIYLHDLASGKGSPFAGSDTDRRLGIPRIEARKAVGNIALGHRRLSIIDLSAKGHQPMTSPDGLFWIVLNGEIYNYRELRKELSEKGHRFVSSSDTEVVLAAYREWGKEAVSRFMGMFAFAVLDVKKGSLFMARDFFGIKPLYYYFENEVLAFASEIKALLILRRSVPGVNPGRAYDFLRHNMSDYGDETMFKGIKQLPAAHSMELQLHEMKLSSPLRYWKIDISAHMDIGWDEAAHKLRSLIEESVNYHLRSDVPLGSCLSGGLDSSAIVAMMRRNMGPAKPIRTISYIADDAMLSEEQYVDKVNMIFGCIPYKGRLSPGELPGELEKLIRVQELPFMSLSIYAQYKVFQWAKDAGVKVMLDGQGADELFAGYLNLLGARITSELARGRIFSANRLWRAVPSNMKGYGRNMLIASLGRLLPRSCKPGLMAAVGQPIWPAWSRPKWFVERGVEPWYRECDIHGMVLKQEMRSSILKTSLPNLLRFEDRNSMANSIESRVPFCNHKLAEFAFSLPEEYLIDGSGRTKAILKACLKDALPREITTREKVGFAVPEMEWARQLRPWFESTLNDSSDADFPMLEMAKAKRMLLGHMESRDKHLLAEGWRLVMLIKWKNAWGVDFAK